MPQAPSVNLFYEFLGGKKPEGPPAAGGDGGLEDLLDKSMDDLEFNPTAV